jgi:hypothetical protein
MRAEGWVGALWKWETKRMDVAGNKTKCHNVTEWRGRLLLPLLLEEAAVAAADEREVAEAD